VRTSSWDSVGSPPPTSGSYLRVEVELFCSRGQVGFQPAYFSLFDADGQLVEGVPDAAGRDSLSVVTLSAGEQVRGTVVFDLTRQRATLVLSDDLRSVTAIAIAG